MTEITIKIGAHRTLMAPLTTFITLRFTAVLRTMARIYLLTNGAKALSLTLILLLSHP
jgi:hypothetical protein